MAATNSPYPLSKHPLGPMGQWFHTLRSMTMRSKEGIRKMTPTTLILRIQRNLGPLLVAASMGTYSAIQKVSGNCRINFGGITIIHS